jgi:hypothetical protein
MEVTTLPALFKPEKPNGGRQSSRRHFRCGVCAAALRALTAAKAYMFGGENITLEQAAARHGSCVHYVRAGITLIQSDDQQMLDSVMRGNISLLMAAEAVKPLAMLLTGYAQASPKVKDDFFARTGCTADLGQHLIASSPAQRAMAAARLDAGTIWNETLPAAE